MAALKQVTGELAGKLTDLTNNVTVIGACPSATSIWRSME